MCMSYKGWVNLGVLEPLILTITIVMVHQPLFYSFYPFHSIFPIIICFANKKAQQDLKVNITFK